MAPERLLPLAEELLARTHRVEDRSVEIVRAQPRIELRFVVAATHDAREDADAEASVRALVHDLAPTARLGRWTLRRGPGGHWRTIRSGDSREGLGEHPVDF
ncbi:hypothetical protein [Janibacter sp. GS2]|uniref:hypothetical protein n=1 Tax=Janibacter sp. GS2 TaxID=3442646 RepID=UPI003EB752DE